MHWSPWPAMTVISLKFDHNCPSKQWNTLDINKSLPFVRILRITAFSLFFRVAPKRGLQPTNHLYATHCALDGPSGHQLNQ